MKKYKWSEKFICVILLFQLIIEIKSDSAFSDSDSYTFETFSLPENGNFMPVLGNGHVGFQILSDSVYMNNLYNGAQGLSHRARIPNFGNIQIINYGELNGTVKYTMDTKSGIFRTSFSPKSKKYRLDHLIYAHRFYDRAIVNQFFISDLNCSIGKQAKVDCNNLVKFSIKAHNNNNDSKNFNEITIKIGQYPGNATDDIEFMIKSGDLGDVEEGEQPRETDKVIKKAEDFEALKKELSIKTMCGSTKTVEDPIYQEDPSNCCVLWNHVPEEITLCGTAVKKTTMSSFTFVMTVDEHFSVAQQEMMDVLAQTDLNLLNTHMEEWKHFWNDFDIHMDDSSDEGMNLARTIHASIFYIVSSLPSLATNQPRGAFGGLSPTGLGRGGSNLDDYEGHVFWDSEIWMHIPVLLINPTWSEEMLHYRFLRAFPAALDYAQKTGYKGIRFPWESAFTGREVTQPCCPLVAANQHHITADISYALRLHLATTRDIHWFKREGCKLAIPIAQFWASRVSHNSTTNKYDINNIMGPDEDHENVDNNFYTNIAARQSLQFGQ
ncbi:protein-glucosylgalactosylhydroxylysine glucosidase [Sergentomyia squamirostris]